MATSAVLTQTTRLMADMMVRAVRSTTISFVLTAGHMCFENQVYRNKNGCFFKLEERRVLH